jgi:hypothetical protein
MDSSWRLLGDGYEVVNKSGTSPVRFRVAR